METVTVAAQRTVALAPHEVFGFFGSARGAGWLFDAHCDEVRPGAVVSLRLPLDGTGGHTVDVLGRLARVAPSAAIDMKHTRPWRGRLSLRPSWPLPAPPTTTRRTANRWPSTPRSADRAGRVRPGP